MFWDLIAGMILQVVKLRGLNTNAPHIFCTLEISQTQIYVEFK